MLRHGEPATGSPEAGSPLPESCRKLLFLIQGYPGQATYKTYGTAFIGSVGINVRGSVISLATRRPWDQAPGPPAYLRPAPCSVLYANG
ncbi:MAG: hypothetical protein CMG82_14140 [Marinobacter sp.]|nr:hypothetical protein [Marinobacter sp.]